MPALRGEKPKHVERAVAYIVLPRPAATLKDTRTAIDSARLATERRRHVGVSPRRMQAARQLTCHGAPPACVVTE